MGGLKSKYRLELYRPKPNPLSFKDALLVLCCPSEHQLRLVRKYGSTRPSHDNKFGGQSYQSPSTRQGRNQQSQSEGRARRPQSGAAQPEDIQLERIPESENDSYEYATVDFSRRRNARQPKAQPDRPSTLHLRHIEDKVCVASTNKSFLDVITNALCNLSVKEDAHIHIVSRYINKSEPTSELSYFLGAGKVILIATGSQRLLLISGVEEAQLNRQFTLARNNGVDIFLILAGHAGSETMLDTDLYVPELEKMFKSQPAVKELASRGRFISTGYSFNVEDLEFNYAQNQALLQWMKGEGQYDVRKRKSGSPV